MIRCAASLRLQLNPLQAALSSRTIHRRPGVTQQNRSGVHTRALLEGRETAPANMSRPLVIWDFDWTVVNENSDTWIIKELERMGYEGMNAEFNKNRNLSMPWTELMDQMMVKAHELGADEAAITQALVTVPFEQANLRCIRAAAAAGVAQIVVSDANEVFIQEILRCHSLQGVFAEVHTNTASYDACGALRVGPYHTEPHGCKLCPPNLCKGKVLNAIRAARPDAGPVIYLGDGSGDLCPALLLGTGDHVLARKGYSLLKQLEERAKGGGEDAPRAAVFAWEGAADIELKLKELLGT